LRNRLIATFVAATALPLAATVWVAMSLLDRSLTYAVTPEMDRLTRALESSTRELYRRERDALLHEARNGLEASATYASEDASRWPEQVRAFWESGEPQRVELADPRGNDLHYLVRRDGGVDVFRRELQGVALQEVSGLLASARERIGMDEERDLRRGFTLTLFLLIAGVWVVSLAPLLFLASRISRPIQQLTEGLTDVAAGDMDRRVLTSRRDEVGRAIRAFNDMAAQLQQSRERLVYLTQVSSWQTVARKTAHELKNSLTPIRLTVEEILARTPHADRPFMEQAAQIVIGEIETLERRVRAFSEFAAEPAARPDSIHVGTLVAERIALLRPGHPTVSYEVEIDPGVGDVWASTDLVKGILTNLLENAADAAGPGGRVLTRAEARDSRVLLEVHDSGPGLSSDAAATLFEPSITFKPNGMGLGLTIARKNALLCGGDLVVIDGLFGGAGFRVLLPASADLKVRRYGSSPDRASAAADPPPGHADRGES
jgi:signal transduction histidine kinase